MALADDIRALRDRVLADLDAAHDQFADTKTAWCIALRSIADGETFTVWFGVHLLTGMAPRSTLKPLTIKCRFRLIRTKEGKADDRYIDQEAFASLDR